MTNETFASDAFHPRTNRELFCPRENTGNPQHDFFAHYSRLSQLDRLSLEQHTVNGTQISRYEPDIEHSTCGVKPSSFVSQLQDKAREIVRGAALLSALAFIAPALASVAPVRDALVGFDLRRLETAENMLSAEAGSAEFPTLANRLAALLHLAPEFEQTRAVDHSLEVKIATPVYAARALGNGEDAAEFVRCLKLIAGEDASRLYLQQLASHYYAEARRRPVPEVLKEMGLLALELSAVTATSDQLAFDEAEDDSPQVTDGFAELSPEDARELWLERAAEILGDDDPKGMERIYADELRAQTRLVYRREASGLDYDEFEAHLSDVSAATEDDGEFGAYLTSFERAYEQFDEGYAVSLHMTDTDRKIVCGDLDDDVDAEFLPEAARHLASELHRLYTSGFPLTDRGEREGCEGVVVNAFVRDPETRERTIVPTLVYGIDSWMDAALDEAFGERVRRTSRRYVWLTDTKRKPRAAVRERIIPRLMEVEETKRGATTRRREIRHFVEREVVSIPRSRLHEQTETIEVCADAEERAEARAVLETLLDHLKRDCHTRGLNQSASYRQLSARLESARDTAVVAAIKREAWQDKEAGRLSFKLFTALNTRASARQAGLETEPLTELRSHRLIFGAGFTMTQTFADGARPFIVAQPLLNKIPQLTGKTIGDFARALHLLPRQERERVRRAFGERNPQLYGRVRDGLNVEISRASQGRLRYFRWAFYAGNKPEHPVHILTREDQSAAWEMLKRRALSGTTPLLPFVEARESSAVSSATSGD